MSTPGKNIRSCLKNQPESTPLPDITVFKGDKNNLVQKYIDVFKTIGGNALFADNMDTVKTFIRENFDTTRRIVTTLPALTDNFEMIDQEIDPHTYDNAEVAIINTHFAVAENGAVWLTEEVMGQRIIPYICQHLAVIVKADSLVPTMHEAYEKIEPAIMVSVVLSAALLKPRISNRRWCSGHTAL
ncbi:MAG: LUD domain-containing protein [Chitinophagaceae bacterium]